GSHAAVGDTVDDDFALVESLNSANNFNEGGLAAAILTGEAMHFSRFEVYRDVLQGLNARVGLMNIEGLENETAISWAVRHHLPFKGGPTPLRVRPPIC